jgi:hypothetical protein
VQRFGLKYTFTCRFETEARLPGYLGKIASFNANQLFFPSAGKLSIDRNQKRLRSGVKV